MRFTPNIKLALRPEPTRSASFVSTRRPEGVSLADFAKLGACVVFCGSSAG